jgi:hypothetical protein
MIVYSEGNKVKVRRPRTKSADGARLCRGTDIPCNALSRPFARALSLVPVPERHPQPRDGALNGGARQRTPHSRCVRCRGLSYTRGMKTVSCWCLQWRRSTTNKRKLPCLLVAPSRPLSLCRVRCGHPGRHGAHRGPAQGLLPGRCAADGTGVAGGVLARGGVLADGTALLAEGTSSLVHCVPRPFFLPQSGTRTKMGAPERDHCTGRGGNYGGSVRTTRALLRCAAGPAEVVDGRGSRRAGAAVLP